MRLALKLKDVIAEQAKKHQIENLKKGPVLQDVGKREEPIHTDKELGKLAGVSHETIRRYELIQKEGTLCPQQ